MKRWICMLLCGMVLMVCPAAVTAEGTSEPAAETVQQEDNEPSKGMKIAGFMAIFTVSMGVTGYIVVRPKLRMLKEAREKRER